MTNPPLPLYYTFGNHMHWVDMEWLWGYHVLPGSVRDMLHFCARHRRQGQRQLRRHRLRKAGRRSPRGPGRPARRDRRGHRSRSSAPPTASPTASSTAANPTSASASTASAPPSASSASARAPSGKRSSTSSPSSPSCWAASACAMPRSTSSGPGTRPKCPWEPIPAVWWEGQDGTRLLTGTRNKLNLHQWPEDFAALLGGSTPREMPIPGIVQWLELMPSPDWMCRAELMLPQLAALLADPSFDVRFATLSEYLEAARPVAEVRRYTLADVFHGMSLGKNGDLFRRLSRRTEQALLAAESLSALLGLFGRPYAQWDVYPTWELEEAWRDLLAAQHHDNDECEGLCGHVGLPRLRTQRVPQRPHPRPLAGAARPPRRRPGRPGARLQPARLAPHRPRHPPRDRRDPPGARPPAHGLRGDPRLRRPPAPASRGGGRNRRLRHPPPRRSSPSPSTGPRA